MFHPGPAPNTSLASHCYHKWIDSKQRNMWESFDKSDLLFLLHNHGPELQRIIMNTKKCLSEKCYVISKPNIIPPTFILSRYCNFGVFLSRIVFWKRAAWLMDGALTWWRHQMETFSALLALCAENSPVTGEFLSQRPVMRSFDGSFDLHLNKRLSKQWWGWWFETPSRPLWRHDNE